MSDDRNGAQIEMEDLEAALTEMGLEEYAGIINKAEEKEGEDNKGKSRKREKRKEGGGKYKK